MKVFIYLFFLLIAAESISSEILEPNPEKGRVSSVFSDKILVRLKPGYDIFEKDAILIKTSEVRVDYMLHPKSSITYNSGLLKSLTPNLQKSKIYNEEEKILRTFTITYDGVLEPEDYCRKLILTNPAVEIAEPYYVPELFAYLPNDPLLTKQDRSLRLISAYEAWEIEKGDPSVVIGISDSGTNQDHEDINPNLGTNESEIPDDGIDNDQNGYIDDYQGFNFAWESTGSSYPGDTFNSSEIHGQQVAGIAGAATNNSVGIAGIAFNSKIFPLKIIEGNQLKYAYESIVYAAARGLKVINCSWGVVKPFSDIDQSIINYAISRDVAIVASAGNVSNKATKYDLFYPAGYYGVLGVGEVNLNDRITNSSSISAGCRILAPGEGNHTTTNYGYSDCDGGTSFSSPVVAGAVALARSRYPKLSAIQALEFVRQSVDRHSKFSTEDLDLIPGRLNLLKAVSTDPYSMPAILPQKYSYFDIYGTETNRFSAGDKVTLKITAKNELGAASDLQFILRKVYDPTQSVTVLDSVVNINYYAAGEVIDLGDFSLMVNQNFSGYVIMRVDIIGPNGYKDFFKFNFVPAQGISTFANDEIKFSMSDEGEFGFVTNTSTVSGIGFAYKDFGNQIYRNSSVMLSASDNRIVYNSSINKVYDFQTVKGFVNPDRNIGIFNDSKAGTNWIGVEVTQEIEFPDIKSKSVRMNFKLENTSNQVISNGAMGMYIDWDVSLFTDKNRTKLLSSAIPDGFSDVASAAQIVYVDDKYPYFGSAVYSSDASAEAISAGLEESYIGSFDKAKRYQAMNSGKEIQTNITSDIGTLTGIKFAGDWQPNEIKKCVICIGAGDSEAELSDVLKNCLLGETSIRSNNNAANYYSIYPNPVSDIVYFGANGNFSKLKLAIFDLIGNKVGESNHYNMLSAGETIGLDVNSLPNGLYILQIQFNSELYFKKIIISR